MRDVTTEAEARALSADDFYRHLVARNRGLVSVEAQRAVRRTRVLVAGCGSIGGAAIEPLARIGFENLHLVDSGTYELNNLNRQRAWVRDIGENKAAVAARVIGEINPHARVSVTVDGITADNADAFVADADLIIDGVDVTTMSGLRAKLSLHEAALAHRRPLVTGWDLAGMLCAEHIDYRRERRVFGGAITSDDLDRLSVWESIVRIAPMRAMPSEMLAELADNLHDPDYGVPQLPEAAWQFGSLACHMAVRIAAGRPIPPRVGVDVHAITRPLRERVRDTVVRPVRYLRFARALGLASTVRATVPRPLLQFS
ncbi:HesA/MoeB/ThiF family protein [Nocardiopsis lambiniae]|uniref:ThiF family adenylyltransferase n=1 Tax=Nocardiopsis lambiniae TaxID=3075539 RepID=A0ABU2MC92_9ACTN|nr:ThiF family adenylyltransferase [Nocardiopsis sp. DSM 44743]MDT0329876.1 ThiF family adenylyltransferase [Nocardiopsis sp. DSM 44743]